VVEVMGKIIRTRKPKKEIQKPLIRMQVSFRQCCLAQQEVVGWT
jgi:hypothetical protein